jgi:hypothetical protein
MQNDGQNGLSSGHDRGFQNVYLKSSFDLLVYGAM